MKQNQATRRAAETARQKLSTILMFEISDPELELVTITGVEVSMDRSFMKVYVSCEKDRYDEVMSAFKRAKGRIRSLLGHALGWRVTPDIVFVIDNSTDEAERIARALEQVPPTLSQDKDEFGYPVDEKDASDEEN